MHCSKYVLLFGSLLLSSSWNLAAAMQSTELPRMTLNMFSQSNQTTAADLLREMMIETKSYLNNYLRAFYNRTGTDAAGFAYVVLSDKFYGIVVEPVSTSSSSSSSAATPKNYSAKVDLHGSAYFQKQSVSSNELQVLMEYALDNNNRDIFIDQFLTTAPNAFLQNLVWIDATVAGKHIGTPTEVHNHHLDPKQVTIVSTTTVSFFVLGTLVIALACWIRRRKRLVHQQVPRSYGPVETRGGLFTTSSSAAAPGKEVLAMERALSSPSALRADRDEELVPHQGGRKFFGTLSSPWRGRKVEEITDDAPPPPKTAFNFSKWQTEDMSQYSSVATEVEAWKNFSAKGNSNSNNNSTSDSGLSPPTKAPVSSLSSSRRGSLKKSSYTAAPQDESGAVADTSSSSSRVYKIPVVVRSSNSSTERAGTASLYSSPSWTTQNRFHFDIDGEEVDDGVEEQWKVIT